MLHNQLPEVSQQLGARSDEAKRRAHADEVFDLTGRKPATFRYVYATNFPSIWFAFDEIQKPGELRRVEEVAIADLELSLANDSRQGGGLYYRRTRFVR